jgi:EpsI family protein
VPGVAHAGGPLQANRALIRLGNQRQLVYYWFQQRGRIVTNEYLAKWYLFVDSLRINRTDGALVRLTTPLAAGEDVAAADRRLAEFAARAMPELERFVPR